MKIVQIPLLRDNYAYLIICPKTNNAAIVDPSEAAPVERRVEQEKVTLTAILNTHHHRDHTGGNSELLAGGNLEVYGHKSDQARIPGWTHGIDEGDEVRIGELRGNVLFIPGHTTGHVAYLFGGNLFCGDTLFTAGCGRLFEGTAAQMHGSLKKLMALPDETKVYCGHEYTESNLRFALTLEPKNHKLLESARRLDRSLNPGRGKANQSVFTLGQQRNPNQLKNELAGSSPGRDLRIRPDSQAQGCFLKDTITNSRQR
jgi:hydroxyacylglutathione hydrolase